MHKMRPQFRRVVLAGAAILLFSLPALSRDRTPLEDHLLANYKDKPQILQGLYCGKNLRFDADAKLLDGAPPGPWTVCGEVRIEDIEVKQDEIRIKARRVHLVFDSGKGSFQDVELLLPKKEKNDKNRWNDRQLEIRMAQKAGEDETALQSELDRLFRPADKDFSDMTPDYWKAYLQGRTAGKSSEAARKEKEEQTAVKIPVGATGDTPADKKRTDPRIIHAPDPEYSDEARAYKFQGSVTFRIIVDTEGMVQDIRIVRALGLGLDERAAETVKKWKFIPGKDSNGKPVPVPATVDVKFRLY
jgi:TonB family protein